MTWVMLRYLCTLEWWERLPKFPSMASLSHRQSSSFPLLLALLPVVLLGSSSGEDPQTKYHTGTSEVRVAFFATDQNGRLLDNLSKDDFAVIDSGMVIRDFRSLARNTETALEVVALIDTSESVAPALSRQPAACCSTGGCGIREFRRRPLGSPVRRFGAADYLQP